MSTHVRIDHHSGVALVTVDRPAARNALDKEAWHDLLKAFLDIASDARRTRVAVLRGSGDQAFIAGADLDELDTLRKDAAATGEYIQLVESVMVAIEQLPQPVIAMVNGYAIGAGAEIMAASDLRITSASARIGIPAAKLGLALTAQDISRLERIVGLGRTQWMLLTGELVAAELAMSWGLVQAVYPSSELYEAVMALADQIARNSPTSMRLMKETMRAMPNPARHADGFRRALVAWAGDDLGEGLRARAERRDPLFGAGLADASH